MLVLSHFKHFFITSIKEEPLIIIHSSFSDVRFGQFKDNECRRASLPLVYGPRLQVSTVRH